MKEVASYYLKEGMVLARNVTTPSGQIIFKKGKTLSKQAILQLTFYNIQSVFIEGEEEDQLDSPSAVKSYSQKIKTSQKFQSFQIDHTMV